MQVNSIRLLIQLTEITLQKIGMKVPDGIDLEVAATLMTKGLTTFYLLHKTFPCKIRTDQYFYHAAAGGVGQIFGPVG